MKKMIVALMVFAAMLSAAIVDVSRAQKVAENYYQNYAPESAKGNTVQQVLTKEYMSQPTWYVFNFTKGFVIVAADDAVRPILGYSFKGSVGEDLYNMQNPFIHRFGFYDRQIVHNVRENGGADPKAPAQWKDIENNVFSRSSKAVIVDGLSQNIEWGQGYPWNDQCPTGCPVGCVATAMHIIMRVHQGPATGAGSHSYNDTAGSVTGPHSVTFADFTYDWGLIEHIVDYNDVVTQDEIDELATLSYHCGVSVDMDYETDGSGTQTARVPDALETYFSFDSSGNYIDIGTVTDETIYASTIWGDLDLGHPLQMRGTDATYGGHSYVLDGYTDDYWYSFNWGWDGGSNGWYQLTDLNTGSGDFTSSQGMCYNLFVNGLQAEWPFPENLGGTISNFADVSLSWDRPSGVKYGTLTGYNIYKDGELIGNVGSSTTTYDDLNLSEGTYKYTVKATYTSPDGTSLASNVYEAEIASDPNYPCARFLLAETELYQRQDIDLQWSQPFLLSEIYSEDFEGAEFATEWRKKEVEDNPPVGRKIGGQNYDNFNHTDVEDGWFHGDAYSFGGDDPEYIHSGEYYAGVGYLPAETTYEWLFSPVINIPSSSQLGFWTWSYGADGYEGFYYVYLYNGDFTETNPSGNLTLIGSYENISTTNTNTNVYDYEEVIDLSSYTGNYRIAFVRYNNGPGGSYQFMVDDVMIAGAGKSSDITEANHNPRPHENYELKSVVSTVNSAALPERSAPKVPAPDSYDIYRNGSFIANVAYTGATENYSDTNYIDGDNEYYVKAKYGANESIASNRSTAFMDANPKPDYLEGVLNGNQIDLSWYKPYHNPPMWYTYCNDFDTLWDNIPGYEKTMDRVAFYGSELGFFYPCTVDSIAAAFGEFTDLAWNTNTCVFDIYTPAISDGSDSVLYTSGTLTAVDGEFITVALPTPLTMIKSWRMRVYPSDTTQGSPFIFADVKYEDEVNFGSSSSYLTDGWYGINDGADHGLEWWMMCYVTSATAPDITKSGWTGPALNEKMTDKTLPQVAKEYKIFDKEEPNPKDTKGLTDYQVWRNGSRLATTTGVVYSDLSPLGGDNTYEITAIYDNPVGESDPSNQVVIPYVSSIEAPDPIATLINGANIEFSWSAVAGATNYNVYSNSEAYGTFSLIGNTSGATNWSTAYADKMFYYFTSTDAKTAAPKTIKIAKPSSSR